MVEEKKTEIKRQTAYKTDIASLLKGIFVKKTGWESSYVMTDFGDFSRVNIIAVVVGKDDNYITLDDGTGNIQARFFDNTERLNNISIGDLILIIARPREFSNNIYLTIELIKKTDRAWINYRKKELMLIKKIRNVSELNVSEHREAQIVESSSTASSKEKIINIISQLDNGSGAAVDDIMRISKVSNAETVIQDMLLKGEIFEVKAGRLKLM